MFCPCKRSIVNHSYLLTLWGVKSQWGFYSKAMSMHLITLSTAKWLSWNKYWFCNNGEFETLSLFFQEWLHHACETVMYIKFSPRNVLNLVWFLQIKGRRHYITLSWEFWLISVLLGCVLQLMYSLVVVLYKWSRKAPS